MKKTMAKAGLMVALAWPFAAMAWGPEGHAVVGDVATGLLTPAAKKQVKSILGDRRLGDYEVACWPDEIRGAQEYEKYYPKNGLWHFVDFNVSERYDEDFELKLPGDGNDVVTQVGRWQKELAATDNPMPRRRDALKFLVHFTGDMHQPLHCAYRYGDMGGNMIPVRSFKGRHFSFGPDTEMDYSASIHSVWDDSMVRELMAGRTRAAFAKHMRAGIGPEHIRNWSRGAPFNWAVDSYWKARKEAYRWANGENLPFKWSGPGMELTSGNYIDARLPLAQEQLQKAGVRLARLLNEALDPKYAPASAE
ncbi:MAG: S1/P1 nuclease [Kiritimatiellia bacterium]